MKYKRLVNEHKGKEAESDKTLRTLQKTKEAEIKKLHNEISNLKGKQSPLRSQSRGLGRLKNTLNRGLVRNESRAEITFHTTKHTEVKKMSKDIVSKEIPRLNEVVESLKNKLNELTVQYNEILQELNMLEEKNCIDLNKVKNENKVLNEELVRLKELLNKLRLENKPEANLAVKLIEVEKARDDYKIKYMEKIEELGKVRVKAEKLKEEFDRILKKKNEQAAGAIKKLEEELTSNFTKEIKRLQIENQELKELSCLQYQHSGEECNTLEYSKETYESELPIPEKKTLDLRYPLDEKRMLLRKITQLEAEQKNYKKIAKETEQKLVKENDLHKQRLLKFKDDYCKVFQEMAELRRELKKAEEKIGLQEEEIAKLRANKVK